MIKFELAKQLKDLGFSQNTTYGWCVFNSNRKQAQGIPYSLRNAFEEHNKHLDYTEVVSAPTFDEIWREFNVMSKYTDLEIEMDLWGLHLHNYKKIDESQVYLFENYTLVEAAANLWIYLKTNNLL
jgi:uncharacterized protein (DUF1697 family)